MIKQTEPTRLIFYPHFSEFLVHSQQESEARMFNYNLQERYLYFRGPIIKCICLNKGKTFFLAELL